MKKKFIKSLLCLCLFNFTPKYSIAQESPLQKIPSSPTNLKEGINYENEEEQALFDVPTRYATLVIDWGITSFYKTPENLAINFWRSRTASGSIYYNIPLGASHFMSSWGIGMSNIDYFFKTHYAEPNNEKTKFYYTIARDRSNRKIVSKLAKNVIPNVPIIKKSVLNINYIDIITELKFNSNKEEPQEGFSLSVGAKIGWQFSPSTIIQYEEDQEDKILISKESFNLNKFRYGVLTRLGWGRFGVVYTQTLSEMFKDGNIQNEIFPWSVGISINLL